MEEMQSYNERAWNDLSKHKVLCSEPRLDLTPHASKAFINPHGFYDDIDLSGKKILCLASGGGQQSIAFALLGADVTIVDFSEVQLQRDKEASLKHQTEIKIIKSDMRDLSFSDDHFFDIVYHPYSINYIPEVNTVFSEVSRVLKQGGYYDLMIHNPYVHGSWKDGSWGSRWNKDELWRGKGYPIWQPYRDGYAVQIEDHYWNFVNSDNETVRLPGPQEYRHTMSAIINGLIFKSFEILSFKEETSKNFDSEPGTWEHYTSCVPPWLYFFSKKKTS
jgi:SAM-dependent methyltransferase